MRFEQDEKLRKSNFTSWWNNEDIGRPIVKVIGIDGEPRWPESLPSDLQKLHIDADFRNKLYQTNAANKTYFGESFPFMDSNMGPGSMAGYLGSNPIFETDTVWYKELAHTSLDELGILVFNPENKWWKEHLSQIKKLTALTKDTPFWTTIPDILENIDILSLLRSPQELCYDMIDEPELVAEYIRQVDDIYFNYYDAMYDIVKDESGACSYTAFSIWAPSTCAKIQCDFSALMSPTQYREFIVNSLTKQTKKIDYTLYHLDGPDAIRHIDAIMGIEKLNALQWTPGVAEADGGDEKWYPLYDKVKEAGKSLWISMDQGNVDRFIEQSRKIVSRFGSQGIYFVYPDLPMADAKKLYSAAERNFR